MFREHRKEFRNIFNCAFDFEAFLILENQINFFANNFDLKNN